MESKNELLERSIDLQTVKIGECDVLYCYRCTVQVGFSKRYFGFFEIMRNLRLFFGINFEPKEQKKRKKGFLKI